MCSLRSGAGDCDCNTVDRVLQEVLQVLLVQTPAGCQKESCFKCGASCIYLRRHRHPNLAASKLCSIRIPQQPHSLVKPHGARGAGRAMPAPKVLNLQHGAAVSTLRAANPCARLHNAGGQVDDPSPLRVRLDVVPAATNQQRHFRIRICAFLRANVRDRPVMKLRLREAS